MPKPIMKIAGKRAKKTIENFMKEFPDYEIEYVVAELQLKPNPLQSKGSLQIKIKPKP